jgi:hypothetical protein
MKNLSIWVLILWSTLCLIGICWSSASLVARSIPAPNEHESTAPIIDPVYGIGIWFVIWVTIALPALSIRLLSGKRTY